LCQTNRQTHRQTTLRATSVAIGRIYATHVTWTNNNITSGQRIFTKGRIARGGFSYRGSCNLTTSSLEHCSRLQKSRCHAVNENCTIYFAAYIVAETPDAFQWTGVGQPLKMPLPSSRGGSRPHLIGQRGSLGPCESRPQTASRSAQPFCIAHACAQYTDTHRQTEMQTTLRATPVAIGRISCTACRRCGVINAFQHRLHT